MIEKFGLTLMWNLNRRGPLSLRAKSDVHSITRWDLVHWLSLSAFGLSFRPFKPQDAALRALQLWRMIPALGGGGGSTTLHVKLIRFFVDGIICTLDYRLFCFVFFVVFLHYWFVLSLKHRNVACSFNILFRRRSRRHVNDTTMSNRQAIRPPGNANS